MRHGGQILVDQLALNGCDTAFCIPGESYLAALDGLHAHPDIKTVICRQEGGAAMMADAYGKLTGRPGICFVTRGPGATNASAGVHVARQDSTPMILFVGQIGRDMTDREAFQEVDYRQMFAPLAKWAAQIDTTERIPEYVSHAYHLATSGRPGPIVLALPEDMLSARCDAPDAKPAVRIEPRASEADMAELESLLKGAERPLVIVGGPLWSDEARSRLEAFSTRTNVPVACAFRYQDYFDNRHDNYAGDVGIGPNPDLVRLVRESDVLVALGPRLGEMTTGGYTLFDIPNPRQTFVHVSPGAEELGRVYRPDVAINASLGSVAEALDAMELGSANRLAERTRAANDSYRKWVAPHETPGDAKFEQVVAHVSSTLPENGIVTNGAGNYAAFVGRYFQYKRHRTQLAPTSGSMGYGLPAAVAAKAVHPDRPVVCFAGDGCLMMTVQEFATAVQYDLPITVVVSNNGIYGTIRMHQEREYPGRVSGTNMVNPDFADLARAFGGHGEKVTRTEDFPAAFERAQASGKPAIVEVMTDPDAVSPRATLSSIRERALASG